MMLACLVPSGSVVDCLYYLELRRSYSVTDIEAATGA